MSGNEELITLLKSINAHLKRIEEATWGYEGVCTRCGMEGKAGMPHICSDIILTKYNYGYDAQANEVKIGDKCRQHETDGTKHWSAAYDDDVYICLKCGEFYR